MHDDNVEQARRLVEEPSGDWYAIERSRLLIEGEEESEIERALRRAPVAAESEWRDVSIAAGFVFAIAVILFLVYGVPAG